MYFFIDPCRKEIIASAKAIDFRLMNRDTISLITKVLIKQNCNKTQNKQTIKIKSVYH